jgi:hypothetical protein
MMSDFVTCLRLAEEVFGQYKINHPKWWKMMDGTPILNDVAVLMATKFAEHESEKEKLITELCDALDSTWNLHGQDTGPMGKLIQRAREAAK